jgi:hypothetical protein
MGEFDGFDFPPLDAGFPPSGARFPPSDVGSHLWTFERTAGGREGEDGGCRMESRRAGSEGEKAAGGKPTPRIGKLETYPTRALTKLLAPLGEKPQKVHRPLIISDDSTGGVSSRKSLTHPTCGLAEQVDVSSDGARNASERARTGEDRGRDKPGRLETYPTFIKGPARQARTCLSSPNELATLCGLLYPP